MIRALLALAILVAGSSASAEDAKEAATKAIARAKEHYKAGRLAESLQELTIAYALDPQKDLLYGIAQIHVKLGHCADAITFYRRYIAAKPDAASAAKAEQAIDACASQSVKAEPVKPPPIQPPPPKPEVPAPSPRTVVVARPFYRDVLGDALVAGGAIGGIVALVVYRSAVATRSDADAAPTYPEYADKLDQARHGRNIALVAGAVGGALIGVGIVRFATHHGQEQRLALAPINGGGLMAWSGRF